MSDDSFLTSMVASLRHLYLRRKGNSDAPFGVIWMNKGPQWHFSQRACFNIKIP